MADFVAETLLIHWHRNGVNSVAFSHGRLVTCGNDHQTRLWKVTNSPTAKTQHFNVEQVGVLSGAGLGSASTKGHSKSVNTVRLSPDGTMLATCSDDQTIRIWQRMSAAEEAEVVARRAKEEAEAEEDEEMLDDAGEEQVAEYWKQIKAFAYTPPGLKVHEKTGGMMTAEVMDLSWGPDSCHLVVSTVRNACMLIRFNECDNKKRSGGFDAMIQKSYQFPGLCQGAAWDPIGRFIVTQGASSQLKVWAVRVSGKTKRETTVRDGETWRTNRRLADMDIGCIVAKVQPDQILPATDIDCIRPIWTEVDQPMALFKHAILFKDQVGKDLGHLVFFRRPAWTPDGAFFIAVSAQFPVPVPDSAGEVGVVFRDCAAVFTRDSLEAHVRAKKSRAKTPITPPPVTPVALLPSSEPVIAAAAHPRLFKGPNGLFSVVAVASLGDVTVYRSDSWTPIATLANTHQTPITDLAWDDADAPMLAVSSTDGFVTLAQFKAGSFGEFAAEEEIPAHMRPGYDFELELVKEEKEEARPEGAVSPGPASPVPPSAAVSPAVTPAAAPTPAPARSKRARVAVEHIPE
ncbi:WD domain, G-beta repeat [Carpediemonas membranifera]|uniref:WD domain, G-beta repeat n=1 Tax=Carpediemonas membranifera TaxID=201153 RepID=A0A8J6AQ36_9EUKA|nr:WD domain, G-beta repeat [Carpediemonas membranifera]|eukprot:KAG9390478.1 WD domain, G-beta repeat [Carpediemonas membranifera]